MEKERLPIEEAQKRYSESLKGKETQKKYNSGDKKKKVQETYFKSEKGMSARLRYYMSDKGVSVRQKRNETQRLLRRCHKFLLTYPDKTVEDFFNSLRGDPNES
jgi:hypothetical protein